MVQLTSLGPILDLKMEGGRASKMSVTIHPWTWGDIPEDLSLHQHHCENFRSHIRL